jgi:hypothetical protein
MNSLFAPFDDVRTVSVASPTLSKWYSRPLMTTDLVLVQTRYSCPPATGVTCSTRNTGGMTTMILRVAAALLAVDVGCATQTIGASSNPQMKVLIGPYEMGSGFGWPVGNNNAKDELCALKPCASYRLCIER